MELSELYQKIYSVMEFRLFSIGETAIGLGGYIYFCASSIDCVGPLGDGQVSKLMI